MLSIAGAVVLMQAAAVLPAAPPLSPPPFGVGETLVFKGKYQMFRPCCATLAVEAIDTVRGVPSYRFSFNSKISILGLFKNESQLTSWTGVSDFVSRRFLKVMKDANPPRQDYRIHPDSGFFRRGADTGTKATSAVPLDDVAFFYYIRRVPLEVGRTYEYHNYWRKAQNPVVVKVVGRETMKLPDGTKVSCLVLHPIVDEKGGMFSKTSNARLWLTDDVRRLPVQIKSTYNFGTVTLVLDKMTLAPPGHPGPS
jgi:hypothetical protein